MIAAFHDGDEDAGVASLSVPAVHSPGGERNQHGLPGASSRRRMIARAHRGQRDDGAEHEQRCRHRCPAGGLAAVVLPFQDRSHPQLDG
jgi:hypothetical protein